MRDPTILPPAGQ